jgi:hypothetical protein
VLAEALIHPVALAALGLLVLNDHLLKSAYPGFLSGKLSDAAGLVVFPLFLHALAEIGCRVVRAPFEHLSRATVLASAAATALAFGAVKSVEPATELYRVGLGTLQCLPRALAGGEALNCRAHVVRDATDLWTLPFVLVSVWLVYQRSVEGERELQAE